jgi:hypothetical protein
MKRDAPQSPRPLPQAAGRQVNVVAGEHMIFALASKDGVLLAFASAADAASRCREADVRDARWLFFSEDGSPLEARFAPPNKRGKSKGASVTYTLQRALSGLWLQERLGQIKRVEGCGPACVADLVELLKINRGKRAAAGL